MSESTSKQKPWQVYAFWIILTEIIGVIAGLLTRQGVQNYQSVIKPALTPPNLVFPIVWSVLYALMGIGAARIALSPASPQKQLALGVYLIQLAFNFLWSLFFFNAQAYGFSFFWLIALWILILVMIYSFSQIDPVAAWLQIPYLLWVGFAGYLNYMVWMLNSAA